MELAAVNDTHNDHLVRSGVDRVEHHKGSAGDGEFTKTMSQVPRSGATLQRVRGEPISGRNNSRRDTGGGG